MIVWLIKHWFLTLVGYCGFVIFLGFFISAGAEEYSEHEDYYAS
jgi:hypothetical protein